MYFGCDVSKKELYPLELKPSRIFFPELILIKSRYFRAKALKLSESQSMSWNIKEWKHLLNDVDQALLAQEKLTTKDTFVKLELLLLKGRESITPETTNRS